MSPSRDRPRRLEVGGWNVCQEAVRAGVARRVFVARGREAELPPLPPETALEVHEAAELRGRFPVEAAQGVVTELELDEAPDAERLAEEAVARGRPLVLLEEVQDPQNLGSALRAARAFGAVGLLQTRHRSAPLSAAAVRASAGAAVHVPVAEVGGVPNWLLQKRPDGLWAVAAMGEGGSPPWQAPLDGPVLLLLGGEGAGLKPLTVERADLTVTIPMPGGTESLNVTQAATALLYEALRQRENAV